ncbi:MAG: glycosyl hydrolase family 18 protein [Egibacteraceae bacterium]
MTSRAAACAIAGLLILAAGSAMSAHAAGTDPAIRPDGHVLLAWLHGGTSEDYRAHAEHMPGVTVLSPTWWGLADDDPGGITGQGDPAFTAWARDRGMAVWPQLGNRLDAELSHAVLADGARRARLVRATAAAVERAGAGGLVVGFENLQERTGPALTALVRELRGALPGRVVAVTVAPLTDTWSRGAWSTAYERRALGEAADYVLLTALDQHDDATAPGPVAGIGWTREAVEHLLRTVPDRKVVLAVPLYARSWVDDPTAPGGTRVEATLGMDAMARRLDDARARHAFDAGAGQRRYTHSGAGGRARQVWQEDAASLGRRAALAGEYNLGGVAGWRAGFAGPGAWDAMSQALALDPRPADRGSGPPRLNRLVPLPQAADPAPETIARWRRATIQAAGGPAQPARGPAVVAAALLLAVVAGHVGAAAHRSSRMSASSAFSSPPTSMVTPDR